MPVNDRLPWIPPEFLVAVAFRYLAPVGREVDHDVDPFRPSGIFDPKGTAQGSAEVSTRGAERPVNLSLPPWMPKAQPLIILIK